MAQIKAKQPAITLSPVWQMLVILVTLGGYASFAALLIHNMLSAYLSAGTRLFQITLWGFPFLLFAVGLLPCWKRGALLKQLFAASLLSWLAYSTYSILDLWAGVIRSRYFLKAVSDNNTSYWSAFGFDWSIMIIALAAFIIALYLWRRSIRRLL